MGEPGPALGARAEGRSGEGTSAERRPPDARTLYDLASLTKVVATTTAAMLLEEEGRLEIDHTVHSYLPEFDAPDSKTVTLGNALAALGDTRAVMVGDRSFDMVAAGAHGLPGIGVGWGIGSRAELTEAGARAIVAAPRELPATVADLLGP